MLQTLARRDDVAALTSQYGLVVVDECHHVPAATFEHAVRQIPPRRWLGLTATPYRRDKLDDLIALQVGPIRHTMEAVPSGTLDSNTTDAAPEPVMIVHPTAAAAFAAWKAAAWFDRKAARDLSDLWTLAEVGLTTAEDGA